MEKEKQESLEEKIARVEKALEEKDKQIADLTTKNQEYEKKLNSIKIDGLVKKVETKAVEVEEPIEFDFDL